jgi:hypothetical protein
MRRHAAATSLPLPDVDSRILQEAFATAAASDREPNPTVRAKLDPRFRRPLVIAFLHGQELAAQRASTALALAGLTALFDLD